MTRGKTSKRNAVLSGLAITTYVLAGALDVYFSQLVSVGWSWITFVLVQMLIATLLLIWLCRQTGQNLSSLLYQKSILNRATWFEWFGVIAICSILWIMFALVFRRVGDMISFFTPNFPGPYLKSSMLPSGLLFVPAVVLMSATYAIVEEIFYRGLIRFFVHSIVGQHAQTLYVFVSATIFAGAHWAWGLGVVIAVFAIGILAAILFVKLRDIRPLICAHFFNDLYYFF